MKAEPLVCALSSQPEPIVFPWPGPEAAWSWCVNIFPQLVGSDERSYLTHDPLIWMYCMRCAGQA